LTTGVFLVGLMKDLGASDVWINLVAALPSLVGVAQIPGGILGRGVRSYKKFVLPGGLTWRLLYVPFIAIPLAPLLPQSKLLLLTACVAFASIATVFVGPVYNDWISQLVPESSRGFYFARRNAIAAAVGAVVGILGAATLDEFRARGYQNQGFTAVFALAIVCAFISWSFFLRMSDLVRQHPARQTLAEGIRGIGVPFKDRSFRPVLVFMAATMTGQAFAGNLFVAYGRESLGLNYQIIQYTAVFMAIGNIVAAAAWGFLVDKYGSKPLLVLGGFVIAVTPLPWVICLPHHPGLDAAILLPAHFFMGIVWAGINLCQFSLLLTMAKPEDRANYLGAAATVTALVGGVSPLLGGITMQWLRHEMPPENAYRLVFIITAVLRLAAVGFLAAVKEPRSTGVREALRDLGGLSLGGVQVLRTLTRPADMATRESAMERAGSVKVALASDEIIKGLHDPLPKVRRRAAMALARLDDPRAVGELVHQINEHPDLLDEETIHALGAVGNLEAVGPLLKVLDSPRPLLRRAAARALGTIGARLDPHELSPMRAATDRLVAIARDPADPDLRRSSLQALRSIRSPDSEEAIVAAILDQWPSVRIAACEAVEEMTILSAAPNLRLSLERFHDEACAEAAYALAVVGDRSDIAAILAEAGRSVSMITRRRCLLGIARLLGVEEVAYRLLLQEGMARDSSLQEQLRAATRGRRRLMEPLALYGAGDEPAALRSLADALPTTETRLFAKHPVDELFLVAALWVASESRK
jgi:HEAT repeat protein/MFS-type transporter involved in bile tolerance (Atg22 family)